MPVPAPRLAWILVAVLFLGVTGLALRQAWPILFPTLVASAPLNPSCDLRQGPCTSVLPTGGWVRFGIEPRTLPVATPLELEVHTEGLEARGVAVDFVGVEMPMGYIRPRLTAATAGRFAGSTQLPVCVRARMEWEARVLVETPRGLVAAPFRFTTQAAGAP